MCAHVAWNDLESSVKNRSGNIESHFIEFSIDSRYISLAVFHLEILFYGYRGDAVRGRFAASLTDELPKFA
jgi:hypothetical protein